MSHFGAIGHHLIVAIIDHIPNGPTSWAERLGRKKNRVNDEKHCSRYEISTIQMTWFTNALNPIKL